MSPLTKKQSLSPLSSNLGCSVTCFDQHNAAECQSPCVGSDDSAGWSDRAWRMRYIKRGREKPNLPPALPLSLCGVRCASKTTPGPRGLAEVAQPASTLWGRDELFLPNLAQLQNHEHMKSCCCFKALDVGLNTYLAIKR